jgi:hypothetical protein
VLEEPHHPDVVERLVVERECAGIRLDEGGLHTGSLEVPARVRELLRLDVDAVEADARELLAEHRQHRADAAPDLQEPRSRLERRAVGDQAVAPVLRLLHETLLLARAVAVDVVAHALS